MEVVTTYLPLLLSAVEIKCMMMVRGNVCYMVLDYDKSRLLSQGKKVCHHVLVPLAPFAWCISISTKPSVSLSLMPLLLRSTSSTTTTATWMPPKKSTAIDHGTCADGTCGQSSIPQVTLETFASVRGRCTKGRGKEEQGEQGGRSTLEPSAAVPRRQLMNARSRRERPVHQCAAAHTLRFLESQAADTACEMQGRGGTGVGEEGEVSHVLSLAGRKDPSAIWQTRSPSTNMPRTCVTGDPRGGRQWGSQKTFSRPSQTARGKRG